MTSAEPAGARILLVDDFADSLHLYALLLQNAGFTVIEASTGSEALRMARENPDLVLLDLHLPDVDGFEVCRQLKSDPETRRIPVVITTAQYRGADEKAEAMEAGADGLIMMPATAAELIATVKGVLALRSPAQRAS